MTYEQEAGTRVVGGVSGRGKQREGSIGARTAATAAATSRTRPEMEKRRLRLRQRVRAKQSFSGSQCSSQPPALATRLRVSQGLQLVVGVIVRSLCPKVSASRGLVAQQSVISPDPCLGLPMQKIHQSAHLSPFCTRTSVPPPCSHGV